jgi:hypothetical protein
MKALKPFLPLLIFAFLILILVTISCSNDDNKANQVAYNEENPLTAYMALSGFYQKTSVTKNAPVFSESGFSFKPTVAGKINAFIVNIPDVNPALRVTLWDVSTKTILKSETINVPTENVSVEKTITPIALTKDKEYFISINSGDWFVREKKEGVATVSYPIAAGNIIITGFAHVSSKAPEYVFPNSFSDNFYAGDATFKFQQTE